MSVEQMARVGSPEPKAIIRRRQRTGTGKGMRKRIMSRMFFRS